MTDTQQSLDEFLGTPPASPVRKWAIRGGVAVSLLILILLLSRCFSGGEETQIGRAHV